jgi:hypothetical protein
MIFASEHDFSRAAKLQIEAWAEQAAEELNRKGFCKKGTASAGQKAS